MRELNKITLYWCISYTVGDSTDVKSEPASPDEDLSRMHFGKQKGCYVALCGSINYPYLPHWKRFSPCPSPLWKFQLNFIHFLKVFFVFEFPLPPPPHYPVCRGIMEIFWKHTLHFEKGHYDRLQRFLLDSITVV